MKKIISLVLSFSLIVASFCFGGIVSAEEVDTPTLIKHIEYVQTESAGLITKSSITLNNKSATDFYWDSVDDLKTSQAFSLSEANIDGYYASTSDNVRAFRFAGTTELTADQLTTAGISFWVKVPKTMTIQVCVRTADHQAHVGYMNINLTKTDINGGWQEIRLPFSEIGYTTTASKFWAVQFRPVTNATKETFLDVGETLYISAVQLVDNLPSMDKSELLIGTYKSDAYLQKPAGISLSTVNANTSAPADDYWQTYSNIVKYRKFSFANQSDMDNYYALQYSKGDRELRYGVYYTAESQADKKLSGVLNTAAISLWVNAPKDIQLEVGLITTTWKRYKKTVDLTAGGWQQIIVPLSELNGWVEGTDVLQSILINTAGNVNENGFIGLNEELLVSFPQIVDNLSVVGDTEITVIGKTTTNSLGSNAKNNMSVTTGSMPANSEFYNDITSVYDVKMNSESFYNTAWADDTANLFFGTLTSGEISEENMNKLVATGFVRFYIKAPQDMSLTVFLWGNWNVQDYLTIDIKGNGDIDGWQEVIIPLTKAYNKTQPVSRVYVGPSKDKYTANDYLAAGEGYSISQIEICEYADTYKASKVNVAGEQIAKTTYVENQSGGNIINSTVSLAPQNPYYSLFETSTKIEIADAFYDQTYGFKATGLIYSTFKGSTNGTQTITENSYLRFFVKAPKDMELRIMLIDSGWQSVNNTASFIVRKTTEDKEYDVVTIPLSQCNLKSGATGFARVAICATQKDFENDNFITTEQDICLSTIEFWNGKPEDVEIINSKFYYSENDNGVVLEDMNSAVPETTMLFAFEDVEADATVLKADIKALDDYNHKISVANIYGITLKYQTTEDETAICQPTGTVKIWIPYDGATTSLRIAKVNADNATIVKYEARDGYVIFETNNFEGNFVFYNISNLDKGDMNGDEKIDAVDIVRLKKYVAGLTNEENTVIIKSSGDIDGDSNVGALDLAKLRVFIMGDIDTL